MTIALQLDPALVKYNRTFYSCCVDSTSDALCCGVVGCWICLELDLFEAGSIWSWRSEKARSKGAGSQSGAGMEGVDVKR